MGNNGEDLRELLVELAYDELDSVDAEAARARLDQDSEQLLAAFQAVRKDLRTWDDVEPAPSRVAFVALGSRQRPLMSAWNGWAKGMAIAASLVMGFLLTAAIANVRVTRTADGWSFSSGLWTPAVGPAPQPVRANDGPSAPSVPVAAIRENRSDRGAAGALRTGNVQGLAPVDLRRWLDRRLQERGLGSVADDTGMVTLTREQLVPILDDLLAEREARLRSLVQQVVSASEQRQRQQIEQALAGVYQTFDAQRTNDLLVIASELGLLQEDTGRELQRTNAAIDYLITRVATAPGGEKRDE